MASISACRAQPVAATCSKTRAERAPRRSLVVVRAQQQDASISRRQAAAAGLVAIAAAVNAAPAHALFGFGEDSEKRYADDTSAIINNVKAVLALDRDAPERDDAVQAVRKQTNDWVARYRRDASFSGRPSFGNTYSALNAVAGHYNSFGPGAPIPKKRLDRIEKELSDAEKLLARGR